jgi:disulfide oxidoreductase YuzD
MAGVNPRLTPEKTSGYEQNRRLKKGEKQQASFDMVKLMPKEDRMYLKEIAKEKNTNSYFYPMIIRLVVETINEGNIGGG